MASEFEYKENVRYTNMSGSQFTPTRIRYSSDSGSTFHGCSHTYVTTINGNTHLVHSRHGYDTAVYGMTKAKAEAYLEDSYGTNSQWAIFYDANDSDFAVSCAWGVKGDSDGYVGTYHAPSCTDEGYLKLTCHAHSSESASECGWTKKITLATALGHSYKQTSTTSYQAPTCTTSGRYASTTYTCSKCGSQYTEGGGAIPALGHSAGSTYSYSETQHWHTCTRCGLSVGDEAAHTPSSTSTSKPTLFSAAKYTCTVCGYSYGSGDALHITVNYSGTTSEGDSYMFKADLGSGHANTLQASTSNASRGFYLGLSGTGRTIADSWTEYSISVDSDVASYYWAASVSNVLCTAVVTNGSGSKTFTASCYGGVLFYPGSSSNMSIVVCFDLNELQAVALNNPYYFRKSDTVYVKSITVPSTVVSSSQCRYNDYPDEWYKSLDHVNMFLAEYDQYGTALIGDKPYASVNTGSDQTYSLKFLIASPDVADLTFDGDASSEYVLNGRVSYMAVKDTCEEHALGSNIMGMPVMTSDDGRSMYKEFQCLEAIGCASGVIGDMRTVTALFTSCSTHGSYKGYGYTWDSVVVYPFARKSSSGKVQDVDNDEKFYVAYAPSTSYGLGKNLSTQLYLFINWTPTYSKSSRNFNILRIYRLPAGSDIKSATVSLLTPWRCYRYNRENKTTTGYYKHYSSTSNSSYAGNHYYGYVNDANSAGGDSSAYIPIDTSEYCYILASVDEYASASTSV